MTKTITATWKGHTLGYNVGGEKFSDGFIIKTLKQQLKNKFPKNYKSIQEYRSLVSKSITNKKTLPEDFVSLVQDEEIKIEIYD